MRLRTRRTFLGAAAAATLTGSACRGGASGAWRFFKDREARTLEAILERLIPDDGSPGARDAGVIHYIDRQLTTHFRRHRKTYRDGLRLADHLAGGSLAAAPLERQEKVVRELERNPATQPFFDLMLAHAMQGFYGNPRHGGNREFASWRMLGISPLQVRGRAHYEITKGAGNAKG